MAEPSPGETLQKHATVRYRTNAVLFAVLMVALTFWFQKHLQVYVTQVALIGGTMTLWALWELLQSWLKWGWGEDAKDTAKTLFGSGRGTEYVVLGGVVLLVLWLTTSSLYLNYESSVGGGTEYRVEVKSGGVQFLPPLVFSSSQEVAGKPYFLWLRSRELELSIVEPRGFLPLKKTLDRGARLNIRVPGDFQPKKFHILRLVPGPNLFSNLPQYDDYPTVFYQVKISRAGAEPVTFIDLRRQSLYVGASGDDIRWLRQKQPQGESLQNLLQLLHDEKVPPAAIAQNLPSLETNPAVLSTFEFVTGDRITVEVVRKKSDGRKTIAKKTLTLSEGDAAIQPVLLEIPEEGAQ